MTKRYEDDDYLFERMGNGEITIEQLPEVVRAIRHHIRNEHTTVRAFTEVATEADKLAKKALDRIDEIVGIPGSEFLDGGGALGRMNRAISDLKKSVKRATWMLGVGTCGVVASNLIGGLLAVHR